MLKDILEINTSENGYCLDDAYGIGYRGRKTHSENWIKQYEARNDKKANAITTATTDSMVAESIRIGTIENEAKNQDFDSQQYRVYSPEGKSVTICGQGGGVGAKTGLYACPICVPLNDQNGKARTIKSQYYKNSVANAFYTSTYGATLVIETADGKTQPIYQVANGYINIKDKQYEISLPDGYYIIRKLTPVECERLQTLPDNYTAAVSNTQRYKGIGNGWTAEVIIHILKHANVPLNEEIVVLSMYDGIGTGRYCFDKMGYKNVKYFATEIDKYAMQIAMSNYDDIIQLGDAFQVRENDWNIIELIKRVA